LTDVVSFEVKVVVPGRPVPAVVALHDIQPNPPLNPAFGQAAVFDTWNNSKDATYDYYSAWLNPPPPPNPKLVPLPIQILALQITVRTWDFKTEQTRQMTILQDM
jgi:hypothetical protein